MAQNKGKMNSWMKSQTSGVILITLSNFSLCSITKSLTRVIKFFLLSIILCVGYSTNVRSDTRIVKGKFFLSKGWLEYEGFGFIGL